ncbi:hypothetical protein [Amycolatopsis thermoflava]|uniref:hypothetical protein n=1 Tax=Amycolatopsis thermoflava TaxID=84480 RepID=UPI001E4DD8EB|nr:hypothetical protein [Amycolatopsis thermoflava]
MTLLFEGELHVHYGQFYVESRTGEFFDGLTDARGGQSNGLCGAAVPGLLFLTTGLHTGNVGLTVEVLDGPAPVGEDWEEVVEVSFRPQTAAVRLVQWAGEASWPLDLEPVDYRVRYCASGMDRARAKDTRLSGEPPLDRYLLQLWPTPPADDAVVRETSATAAYWHEHARTLPPPPTPEQRAEARRRERLERDRAHREAARAAEARRWGGRPPGERLKRVNGGLVLARLDRDLTGRARWSAEPGRLRRGTTPAGVPAGLRRPAPPSGPGRGLPAHRRHRRHRARGRPVRARRDRRALRPDPRGHRRTGRGGPDRRRQPGRTGRARKPRRRTGGDRPQRTLPSNSDLG